MFESFDTDQYIFLVLLNYIIRLGFRQESLRIYTKTKSIDVNCITKSKVNLKNVSKSIFTYYTNKYSNTDYRKKREENMLRTIKY